MANEQHEYTVVERDADGWGRSSGPAYGESPEGVAAAYTLRRPNGENDVVIVSLDIYDDRQIVLTVPVVNNSNRSIHAAPANEPNVEEQNVLAQSGTVLESKQIGSWTAAFMIERYGDFAIYVVSTFDGSDYRDGYCASFELREEEEARKAYEYAVTELLTARYGVAFD